MEVVLVILLIVSIGMNIKQYLSNLKLKSNSRTCKIDCELRKDRMRALESELEECNRKRLDDLQPEGNLKEKPKRKPRKKSNK